MTHVTFQSMRALAVVASLLTAAASLARAGQPTLAKLDALSVAPEAAGALVYRGDTFALRTPAGAPLYRYERRVLTTTTGLTASHITHEPTGAVVIVESAVMSPAYDVQRFEVANRQIEISGSVQVSGNGHHLEYALNDHGKASKASEDVSDPVVCGPSLFGFVLKNWDLLMAGATIPVRMLAIKEKTTYGFELKFEKRADGQASFTIVPSSFWVRLAIAPLRVVFDANSKTVVRYEGRVPPMASDSGTLKDLDARVEYTSVSSIYR